MGKIVLKTCTYKRKKTAYVCHQEDCNNKLKLLKSGKYQRYPKNCNECKLKIYKKKLSYNTEVARIKYFNLKAKKLCVRCGKKTDINSNGEHYARCYKCNARINGKKK